MENIEEWTYRNGKPGTLISRTPLEMWASFPLRKIQIGFVPRPVFYVALRRRLLFYVLESGTGLGRL